MKPNRRATHRAVAGRTDASPGVAPATGARPASKYRAVATEVDGIRFASKKEAKRWNELKLLERAGKISRLERQPRYVIRFGLGEKICTYVADFSYWDHEIPAGERHHVAEDVKGVQTPLFKLKAKLFRALYPHIELRLT